MIEFAFLIMIALTVYSYALFPPILWILQLIFRNPWKQNPEVLTVSMIISVYNEEKVIRAKIENAFALNYPMHLLEIIVSSDGSTDKTHDIVNQFDDPRLVLKRFERLGKTECLNRVVPGANGNIILFTDANSMFPPDLLTQLTRNFSDPDIGLVTGWTKYVMPGGGQEVTGMYAKLEKVTKYWESLIASCVGADGAVFAIRKSLYQPLGADDINDFIIPLNVVRQQRRAVLDPSVFCSEEAADSDRKAYQRQVRITTRTLWAIRRNLTLLSFSKYGFFSFFMLSHKILRLAAPFFFIAALLLNIALMGSVWLFNLTFVCFILFFALGLINRVGLSDNKLASICKFFLITFKAQLIGWFRMAVGIRDKTWTPQR